MTRPRTAIYAELAETHDGPRRDELLDELLDTREEDPHGDTFHP